MIFNTLVAALAALALSLSGNEDAALRDFDAAAVRWQSNPDFRRVAVEYCVKGSRAVEVRPWGIPGQRLILGLRSLPFLPKRFAAEASSRAHYEHFDAGPLSAYLYLCDEQSVPAFVGVVEAIGTSGGPGDAGARSLIDSFHVDFPTCKDAGAVYGVSQFLRDVDAKHPFNVREDVGQFLVPYVRDLAAALQLPREVTQMSPLQQLAVLERLDDYVKEHDPELWRAKQLSDLCAGVWAQVYSLPYRYAVRPVIVMHAVAGPLLGLVVVVWLMRRARHRALQVDNADLALPSDQMRKDMRPEPRPPGGR